MPVSLGVLFPGVSIWMYEFVTDGSSTMDWLCRFVKDKGSAGIIDFALFSARAAKRKLPDKPIVCMYVRCFSFTASERLISVAESQGVS